MSAVLLDDGWHTVIPGSFSIVEVPVPHIGPAEIFWGPLVRFHERVGGVIFEVRAWLGQVFAVRLSM